MPGKTVNVAEYLFTRLRQLGCEALHGLPGDFNLLALDYVQPSGLTWVGNCNELNAGYAADAYARVRGLGAILTTFGVGELSAINAIAGAYAELAPVVHIVGTPARSSQADGMLLHHTLGNGDFWVFADIHKRVTIAQADLIDTASAPYEIDRVLRTCFVESRPVYIQLPTDMVTRTVDASLLDTPIDTTPHASDPDAETLAVKVILDRLYAAEKPVVLVDGGVQRRRILSSTDALIRKLGIPIFVAPMGKGTVDESLSTYVGVYAGEGSHPDVQKALESSDLILTIGNLKSDLNTAGFTYHFSKLNTIDIHYDHCNIGYARFDKVFFKSLVPRLEKEVDPTKVTCVDMASSVQTTTQIPKELSTKFGTDTITHEWLWPRMSSWLQEGDIIVTDTGTSYVGYWETKMPPKVEIINQILWSSIGYGVGATQGAGMAAKELGKGQRTICFEGDGSFQLTAQELSTIIHHDLNVTMFLIENGGYTIERFVHGLEAHYNDVPQWQYSKLASVLTPAISASNKKVKTWRIESRAEFDNLLNDEEFKNGKGLQFCEIHMPKLDAPKTLIDFGAKAEKSAS